MSDIPIIIDEETPLLADQKSISSKPTPLPKLQIAVILLLQLCEPIASQSILPYINQLVSELDITGGDERKVGYYAGLIESLFFVTEAVTVLQWSRASDYIGRKPVLLVGVMGTAVSMLCFGLSRTFWKLVISRCLCGLLNGNIGVMKSVMGELTDPSNRAQGFSFLPIIWGLGSTVGPLMGGTLARPHERFPNVFGGHFWKEYPYFLPCVASAAFVGVAFVVAVCLLKETAPMVVKKARPFRHSPSPSEATVSTGSTKSLTRARGDPVTLRELFVFPVVISVLNYMALAFINICLGALLPLFFAMPVEIGGLGFDPRTIGYVLGSYGAGTGLFQVFFFARFVRHFGARRMFISTITMFLPIFMLFPIMSICAQSMGVSYIVWALLILAMSMMAFVDMGFGCIFMYVIASAPNKRSLGATNGLSQTSVSIVRAIGPALSTSLFSLSVEHNILGGYGVYVILIMLTCVGMSLAVRLPEEIWKESDEDSEEEVQ